MMKRMIWALAALAAAPVAGAQTLDAFKDKLRSADLSYGSRVEATEHGAAAAAVRALPSRPSDELLQGYRVRIFFDNRQNARARAEEVVARFKELYPSIPVDMVYENPYFKVTVGNCLTLEEAIILEGKVKNAFEGAFKVREAIPLSQFGREVGTKSDEETGADGGQAG